MVIVEEEIGNEAFYKKAIIIVNETYFFGGAAKTPALILLSERATKERKEYYEVLMKKIKEDKIFVEYLFSLPRTEEAIIKYVRKNGKNGWEDIKKNWMELISHWATVALRYVEHDDFISCIIGDHHTLIGWKGDKDKRIVGITYMTNGMPFYRALFDEIFATGSNAHLEAIQSIEEKLKKMDLI